ncbi:Cleavage polyadenylation factor subunit clp1 [Fusarium equiseti]|uniref:Polynucleotide 5'-hydroxyl-kinase GRC3 n=1 Tax=Fusarium equiseti TaxID=61235 RepID=A0ABQ8R0D3_FUSEQ|nr:Cleavage polyadenylation factor subunit clp1 [Fusarium equiseti]
MSIPGLGQIPTQPTTTSSTRVVTLRPACEWRFQTSLASPVIVKLLSGTAEKDGVELGPKNAYTFAGVKSKILTWHGCEFEVDGHCDVESVAEYANPTDNPANAHMNLHGQLNDMRQKAEREGKEGPRVLVVGPADVGKTTVARTLASYATRMGYQPLVVNTNPREGLLSLPGTLSASVLATIMDPEAVDGWGSTHTSGPSSVPVKLPLVFYYGKASPDEDPDFYRELTSKLAGSVSARLSEDPDVKSSGVIIDGMGLPEQSKDGYELVAHIVDEFSVNVIIVVGSPGITAELSRKFSTERTSLGEPISVVPIDKSDGVVIRDEAFLQHVREAAIKEYFFGDSKRTLSPLIQQVDFDNVVLYHTPEENPQSIAKEDPSTPMQHWTLAIMHAAPKDAPDVVRAASVMGFLYVSDVDEERRKIKLLAPVSGRLGDQPLVWGKWPEPFINLLG